MKKLYGETTRCLKMTMGELAEVGENTGISVRRVPGGFIFYDAEKPGVFVPISEILKEDDLRGSGYVVNDY